MHWTSKQFKAGIIFIAIGAFFFATSIITLETGTMLRMGPGFMPILLSLLLVALGFLVIFERSPEEKEAEERPIPWRGLIFITLAPFLFALTIKGLGLVPALLVLITTSSLASRMMGLRKLMIVTAVLLSLSVLVFHYVLGLPYPLFATWISGAG